MMKLTVVAVLLVVSLAVASANPFYKRKKGGGGGAGGGAGGSGGSGSGSGAFTLDILHVMEGFMETDDHDFLFETYCPTYIDGVEDIMTAIYAIDEAMSGTDKRSGSSGLDPAYVEFKDVMVNTFHTIYNTLSAEKQTEVTDKYCAAVEEVEDLLDVPMITNLRVVIEAMDQATQDVVLGRYCADSKAFLEYIISEFALRRKKRDITTDALTEDDKVKTMFGLMLFMDDYMHLDIIDEYCSDPEGEGGPTEKSLRGKAFARTLAKVLRNLKK